MMMLQHKFVDFIPEMIEEGYLYISIEYCTAIHKCVCGCGNEVVTPLSPTDWKLIFNGKTVSLHPSIGNWSFDCKSHYWIRNNTIEFSRRWNEREIQIGRNNDVKHKNKYYEASDILRDELIIQEKPKLTFWGKVYKFFNF